MEVSLHAASGVEYQASPLPRRSQAALCDPDEMRMKEGVNPMTCAMKAGYTKRVFPKEGALELQLVIEESIISWKYFDLSITLIMPTKEQEKEKNNSYFLSPWQTQGVRGVRNPLMCCEFISHLQWHMALRGRFQNPWYNALKKSFSRDKSNTEWDWFFFKLSFHWKWMLANALGKLEEEEECGTFCPWKLCRKWWKTTRRRSGMNFKMKPVWKKLAFNTGLCDSVPYWTDRRRVYSVGRHAILIDVTPRRKVSLHPSTFITQTLFERTVDDEHILLLWFVIQAVITSKTLRTHMHRKRRRRRKKISFALP